MHEVLRQRLMRRIESLPDEQVYQVLDFIEFLESKYSERHLQAEATGLQRFAEGLEDRIRKKAMNPATLREAFQLIAAADRVLSSVSSAGRQIIDDLGTLGEIPEGPRDRSPGGEGGAVHTGPGSSPARGRAGRGLSEEGRTAAPDADGGGSKPGAGPAPAVGGPSGADGEDAEEEGGAGRP